ncbi:MAG: lysophospholipid acyltransferase family protein [Candidatus Omnitrophota bacterium]|jgi:KDO2-lipid IV(A) lauroyltransferase
MDYKKIRTSISRFLARFGLRICLFIVKLSPSCCLYGFANAIAFVGYRLASKQRKIALDSLKIAFGNEKSAPELERIAKDCFIYMAKSAIELMYLMGRPQALKERVKIIGAEHLDSALTKGKGVILVSAHFGNFPLLLAKLSLEGYKTVGIMRQMRDLKVENIFLKMRNRYGIKTIYAQPRKVCVNSTIESLRNNEAVFIPLDQNFGTSGVFVDFFGVKAATATGPVVLAQRTKASLLPCFIIRQYDDRHNIVFEPEMVLEEGSNAQETILINIQKLTGIIESYIRRYPAEWGWIHRRWKSKPV